MFFWIVPAPNAGQMRGLGELVLIGLAVTVIGSVLAFMLSAALVWFMPIFLMGWLLWFAHGTRVPYAVGFALCFAMVYFPVEYLDSIQQIGPFSDQEDVVMLGGTMAALLIWTILGYTIVNQCARIAAFTITRRASNKPERLYFDWRGAQFFIFGVPLILLLVVIFAHPNQLITFTFSGVDYNILESPLRTMEEHQIRRLYLQVVVVSLAAIAYGLAFYWRLWAHTRRRLRAQDKGTNVLRSVFASAEIAPRYKLMGYNLAMVGGGVMTLGSAWRFYIESFGSNGLINVISHPAPFLFWMGIFMIAVFVWQVFVRWYRDTPPIEAREVSEAVEAAL